MGLALQKLFPSKISSRWNEGISIDPPGLLWLQGATTLAGKGSDGSNCRQDIDHIDDWWIGLNSN